MNTITPKPKRQLRFASRRGEDRSLGASVLECVREAAAFIW
jgi:hypothetical protein